MSGQELPGATPQHDFLKEPQAPWPVFVQIVRQAGHVPTGPRQARNDPIAHRIADFDHYDRNSARCLFCRERTGSFRRDDQLNRDINELFDEFGILRIVTFAPAVVNSDRLAVDVSVSGEAAVKFVVYRAPHAAEKPDVAQGWLRRRAGLGLRYRVG